MSNSIKGPSQFIEPKIIDQMDEYIYKTYIFRAALQLKIWDKVAKGWDTAEKIVANEKWDLPGTQMLLDDLCSLKLLMQRNHRFHLVKEAACYLISDGPAYQGNYLLNEFHWEGEGQLAQTIRTGKRPIHYNASNEDMSAVWTEMYSLSLANIDAFLQNNTQLWGKLKIQLDRDLQVLDVACGPAPRTLALARQNPGIQITLLDWEKILRIAFNFAHTLGVDKQVILKKGDLWTTDFGSNRFNLIYLGNITHFFNIDENIKLFKKAFAALVPSGIIVINALRHEYPLPLDPKLRYYAMSKGGAAYDFAQYRNMLEQTGFINVEDIAKQPIRGVKP
jgi:C-methyltransferase